MQAGFSYISISKMGSCTNFFYESVQPPISHPIFCVGAVGVTFTVLLFTHVCPATGFCRCCAFQIGKICCQNCIIRNFQFRKFLPVNSYFTIPYARPTFLLATTATPVPAQSAIITSPICTGAATFTARISFMQSKILPFGISEAVLTAALSIVPPSTRTVEVTILVGLVTSFFAYASPRGHVFPSTLISSFPIVTVS